MSAITLTKPKAKGRPSKLTPQTRRRILRCIRRGMPFSLAASAAGVALSSLHKWRGQHSFGDAVQKAIGQGADARLKKIEDASDAGDWRASAWLLEHCQPEFFAKTRIQVEAVGQLEVGFIIPQQTLNEIAEARARHEKRLTETNGA